MSRADAVDADDSQDFADWCRENRDRLERMADSDVAAAELARRLLDDLERGEL